MMLAKQHQDVSKATNVGSGAEWRYSKIKRCRQHHMASIVAQVVQSIGFDVKQDFPVYADRMPTQLLAYLRLSRVQDSGEIAKVCFARGLNWVLHGIVTCLCDAFVF